MSNNPFTPSGLSVCMWSPLLISEPNFRHRILHIIPVLYPIDASRTQPAPQWDNQNVPKHCQVPLGDKITPDWELLLQSINEPLLSRELIAHLSPVCCVPIILVWYPEKSCGHSKFLQQNKMVEVVSWVLCKLDRMSDFLLLVWL